MSKRTVYLMGGVEPGMGEMIIKELRRLASESDEDIYLHINSFGGCCRTMVAIRDVMNRIKPDVVTMVIGKAMSAGCFLSCAGAKGKRFATASSQIMIHEPNGMAELTEDGMQGIEYYKDKANELISIDTGLSVSELEELTVQDKYLTPEEAKERGFIDHVV